MPLQLTKYILVTYYCYLFAETTITPEDIAIPQEIGEDDIKIYNQALREGEKKIPYLSILILGRQGGARRGLFHRLVGKDYLKELVRTQKIDNNGVHTGDTRNVNTSSKKLQKKHFVLLGECDRLKKKLDLVNEGSVEFPPDQPAHGLEMSSVAQNQENQIHEVITEAIDYIILSPNVSEIMSKSVTRANPIEKEKLSLVFNRLNFAGQKQYIALHHCFISNRALYLVDFKILEMLEFIHDPKLFNPLDDICYLIRSIDSHIHIYSAEEKTFENVLLIGIHPGDTPCTPKSLKEINDHFHKRLDPRCINRIHSLDSTDSTPSLFIPVENSDDCRKMGSSYFEAQEESGTKCFQMTINKMSEIIDCVDVSYPHKWQIFEEHIHNENEPIMKTQEVKKFAVKSGIIDKKQQDLVLKFFHGAGKINCLGKDAI